MFFKTLLSPKIISILRIFTAHLDILNLLQNLEEGSHSFLDLSGGNRYLLILEPGERPFKIIDENVWKSGSAISSKFLTTIEATLIPFNVV